jgi:hypothetical protein
MGESVVRRRRACLAEGCTFKFWTVELIIGRTFDFKLIMGPMGPQVFAAATAAQGIKDEPAP